MPRKKGPLTGKELDDFIWKHRLSLNPVGELAAIAGIDADDYIDRYIELHNERTPDDDEDETFSEIDDAEDDGVEEASAPRRPYSPRRRSEKFLSFPPETVEAIRNDVINNYMSILGAAKKYNVSRYVVNEICYSPKKRTQVTENGMTEDAYENEQEINDILAEWRPVAYVSGRNLVCITKDDYAVVRKLLNLRYGVDNIAAFMGLSLSCMRNIIFDPDIRVKDSCEGMRVKRDYVGNKPIYKRKEVDGIRKEAKKGVAVTDISRKYGISESVIHRMLKGDEGFIIC